MSSSIATWIPSEILVGIIGFLLLALQGFAMHRAKKVEEGIEKLSGNVIEIKMQLISTPTIASMTAMGERITAAQQTAIAEQNATIRALDRDVTLLKYVFDKDRR